ncbi:hypothetical protein WN71_034000 [Streptomyces mangrovisoli]|uniref:NB-ARC domain-containing protein n=1 Tax=Streptomyces mangrovisoli TaxID=1428628 RepID=A0A1J4NMU3_9ACTN|nr:hypothetical protein WN71_034000 [Streptomyces mangrovisoli]
MVFQGRDITVQLPATLPAAVAGLDPVPPAFAGREEERDRLVALLAPDGGEGTGSGGCVPVNVTGLPGVGKTALALAAAHAAVAAGAFTGGAIAVTVHGYDDERTLTAGQILESLLRGLGIPGEKIPPTEQDRARLYRDLLQKMTQQGHRLLVLLDDVSAAEQVAPVRPADDRHALLITSRHVLNSLVGTTVPLAELSGEPAVELMARTLEQTRPGDRRIRREPEAAARVVELCGGLPLALRITTAVLAGSPERSVSTLADELARTDDRLALLADGERAVTASFELSYRHLRHSGGDGAARLLRLLTADWGTDLSTAAAAALAGEQQVRVKHLLSTVLARAHLVEEVEPDRWRMHDLVRLYVTSLAEDRATADADERGAAVERLLQHYASLDGPGTGHTEHLTPAPAHWLPLGREHAGLSGAFAHAVARQDHALVLRLAGRAYRAAVISGDPARAQEVARAGFVAARRLADFDAQGHMLMFEGTAYGLLDRPTEAIRSYRRAGTNFRKRGVHAMEGVRLLRSGETHLRVRQPSQACAALRLAVRLARRAEDRRLEARCLDVLARALDMVSDDLSVPVRRAALPLLDALGDTPAVAETRAGLADNLGNLGQCAEAAHEAQTAVEIARRTTDRHALATALSSLGTAETRCGRHRAATEAHREALGLWQDLRLLRDSANSQGDLARALSLSRRHHEALRHFKDAGSLLRAVGDAHAEGSLLIGLADTLVRIDRSQEAVRTCRLALSRIRSRDGGGGCVRCEVLGLEGLAEALASQNQHDEALRHCDEAVSLARRRSLAAVLADVLSTRGDILRQAGRPDEALPVLLEARSDHRRLADAHGEALDTVRVGSVLWRLDRREEARGEMAAAVSLSEALGAEYLHVLAGKRLREMKAAGPDGGSHQEPKRVPVTPVDFVPNQKGIRVRLGCA